MAYRLTHGDAVIRSQDSAWIPADLQNKDYRNYLDWLDAGNTPEPVLPLDPDYLAFWDALLVSNVYQSIRAQALVNPGVLVSVTESIAAITDAKAGRPNVPAIQASLDNLLAAGNFTVEELTELYALFVVANLQGVFTLNVSQSPTP